MCMYFIVNLSLQMSKFVLFWCHYGVVYYHKLDSICSHNGLNNFCGFICEPDAFQQHCGSGTGQDNTPVAQDDTPAAAGNYSNVVHL